MKNFIWIMAIVLLLFSMFGCGSKSHYWEPLYPVDHVKEIRIIDVNLIGDSVDAEEDYTLIKDMDSTDFASIFDDIQTIEYKQLGPSPATPYGTSIMILYESGEYEIVSRAGPQQYKYLEEQNKFMWSHSYCYCRDMEQFDEMIEKWLNHINS